jgi:hypothetical protein
VKDGARRRVRDAMMSFVVFLAVIAAFLVVVGVLTVLKHHSCGRLNTDRVSHLQPGHDTPGPGSIYVKGVGTDRSEITEYLEAVSAMESAGCS